MGIEFSSVAPSYVLRQHPSRSLKCHRAVMMLLSHLVVARVASVLQLSPALGAANAQFRIPHGLHHCAVSTSKWHLSCLSDGEAVLPNSLGGAPRLTTLFGCKIAVFMCHLEIVEQEFESLGICHFRLGAYILWKCPMSFHANSWRILSSHGNKWVLSTAKNSCSGK